MEFANIAEFRQNAARVFERVRRVGDVVILRNGRPVGLLVAGALLLLLPPLLRRGARAPGVSRKATNVTVYRDQLRELEQDLAAGL